MLFALCLVSQVTDVFEKAEVKYPYGSAGPAKKAAPAAKAPAKEKAAPKSDAPKKEAPKKSAAKKPAKKGTLFCWICILPNLPTF